MEIEDFRFLLTPEGQALLAEATGALIAQETHLALAERLRRTVEPAQAQAVLETALLRRAAAEKFSRAADMYFTRPALEQASSETVANWRAGRFRRGGFRAVADLGCGAGGDALALAEAAEVIGVDRDAIRLLMARENARAYGRSERFHPLQADLLELPPLTVEAFFFDPARRTESSPRAAPPRRLRAVESYRPPLSLIERWRPIVPHGAVKVGPGIDYAEIPGEAEVEFISLRGEVKECALWFGDLCSGAARRATLLPGGHTLSDLDQTPQAVAVGSPGDYLYEPDGAVIRAHLVQALAQLLDARLIDPEIAYLTADAPVHTPFARCFRLEAAFPFQLKRLRAYLRARNVGRATIKKRGSAVDVDGLRRDLRLEGEEHRIVFLTLVQGRPTALVGEALPAQEESAN